VWALWRWHSASKKAPRHLQYNSSPCIGEGEGERGPGLTQALGKGEKRKQLRVNAGAPCARVATVERTVGPLLAVFGGGGRRNRIS